MDKEEAIKVFFEKFGINLQEDKLSLISKILRSLSYIPYENLTKCEFAKKIIVSPEELISNFFRFGAGGTCFPIVFLLKNILDTIGVSSSFILADRTYAQASHTFIVAEISNQTYILDPGFFVFTPVKIESGRKILSLPQGKLEFCFSGNTVSVSTIFDNGHRKFRYSAKLSKASIDDFISAWEKTYQMEMMNHIIVAKLVNNALIYIKDNHIHVIKDGISKNRKTPWEEIEQKLSEMGIDPKLYNKAIKNLFDLRYSTNRSDM